MLTGIAKIRIDQKDSAAQTGEMSGDGIRCK